MVKNIISKKKKGYIPTDEQSKSFNKKDKLYQYRSVGGFTDKDYDYIKNIKNQKGLDKLLRQHFGKVKTWKRHYDNSLKKIKYYTELRDKYSKRLNDIIPKYQRITDSMNPKVSLKRPTKTLKSWRGKVWWGVEGTKTTEGGSVIRRTTHKKGWVEFYIISDKKRLKKGLNEDDIRSMGQDIFKSKLLDKDILNILDG